MYRRSVCPLVLAALVLIGCQPAGHQVVVQIVSDLTPIVDFDEIRVEVPVGTTPETIAARVGAGYGRGVRLTSRSADEGPIVVRVALYRGGLEVLAAERRRQVAGPTTIVTVRIERGCFGVACGEPLASACLGGMCVSDECTPETPERCPPGECVAGDASTCTPTAIACAETTCSAEGRCVDDPHDERCPAGQACDALRGCVAAAAVVDAGSDASLDAGLDAGVDAGAPRPPIDVRPSVLSAADWTQRPYVATPSCVLTVSYVPTGGNPGDCMRVELSGCPASGSSFAEYLEWNAQDLLDARDGAFCRIDYGMDVLGESTVSVGTRWLGWVGIAGTSTTGGTTGNWAPIEDAPPASWTTATTSFGRSGVAATQLDSAMPFHFTVAMLVNDWANVPDQVLYYDNPWFHVVFDHDGDGECDDVDPTP